MTPARLVGAALAVLPCLAVAAEVRAEFLHTPPTSVKAGTVIKIDGTVSGTMVFSRVVVRVRGSNEDFDEIPLELQYGDLYRVEIPAERVKGPFLEYFVEGVTEASRTALAGTASKPIRVQVSGGSPSQLPDAKPSPVEPEPSSKQKCKKNKKGKLVCDDAPPEPVDAKPEPKLEPKPEAKPEPKPEPEKPVKVEKHSDPKPAEPVQKFGQTRPHAEAVEQPPVVTRSQREALDEELAVYAAEAPGGVPQHLEDEVRHEPTARTVLTAEDLHRLGVRYVYEALELVPGVAISRDVQGNWRIAMRGFRSDAEVLITLNGQRLNSFYDAKSLFTLPVETLERIEIIRGPGAVSSPLGHLSGRINLVTNRTDGLGATASGGLYSDFDGHVRGAHTFGSLQLFADADVVSQGGQRMGVPHDGLDATGLVRDKFSSDRRFLLNAGAGLTFTNASFGSLTASARFLLENRDALLGAFDVVGNASKLQWQQIAASVAWRKPISSGTLSATLWFDTQTTNRLWQQAPNDFQVRATDPATKFPDGILENVLVGTRGFGLDGQGAFNLPAHNVLTVGLAAELQSITSYDYLSNLTPGTNTLAMGLVRPAGPVYPTEDGKGGRGPAADRFSLGIYAHDTFTPVDAVSLQAGIRVDLTTLPTVNASGAWAGSAMVPSFGPRVGATLSPTKSLMFRAWYGRAYRAPTVQEFAETLPNTDGNQGRFVGNRGLQGEYLDSVEAGSEYAQAVGDGRLVVRGSAFFERFTTPIAAIDDTGNIVPYRNRLLGTQGLGAQAEGRLELSRRLVAWVNVSFVRAEDLGTPATARLLTDTPQVLLNGGLSVPLGRWLNVDLIGHFASERRNNSRSVLELIRRYSLPGMTTVAAQLRTEPLFDVLELSLLGQNVFAFTFADDAARPDRITAGVPRDSFAFFALARVRL